MTADGQNCSKILFKIQNSLNYAKITEMFKVLVWEFHSWWTSPSVGDFCFIIKLRGPLSRAGQQKQFDSDQIWDCQRKQVALLQHQRWKEDFFFGTGGIHITYWIGNRLGYAEFPNHIVVQHGKRQLFMRKYMEQSPMNRRMFCCQVKFPTFIEYKWMVF